MELLEMTKVFSSVEVVTISKAILGAGVIFLLMRILQKFFLTSIKDKKRRFAVNKSIAIAGYIIIIGRLIVHFVNGKTDFALVFGVIGAGMAFALQEVIASFAGWLAIMFGEFYKVGDRVQLGGIKGDVIDIGVLRSTIMEVGEWINGDQYNGRVVRVANSFVFKEPVYNFSANGHFLWDEATFAVKFGSDYRQVRKCLTESAKVVTAQYISKYEERWQGTIVKYMVDETDVHPEVMIDMKPYWVEFSVRYIAPHHDRRTTRNKITQHFLKHLEEYPNIHLLAMPNAVPVVNATGDHHG